METHNEVPSSTTKPVILISAKDLSTVSAFITELTENIAVNSEVEKTNRRQWQIINKYYCVDVEIRLLADGEPLPSGLAEYVEAHLIFIADTECLDGEAGEALAEQRWGRARGAGERAAVRLLLIDWEHIAAAPQSWAHRRRYESVPLRQRAEDDPDRDPDAPFAETYGVERARAALHSHSWRGLRRLDQPLRSTPPSELEPTSSDDDYEGLDESDDEAAVERAEAFAEALCALGEAGELEPAERRLRADGLVAAFCHALGNDLPAL